MQTCVRELHSYLSNFTTKQSLKAENEKLKKRVEDVFNELKQLQDLFKTRGDDGHVESSSEAAEQMKSLEYLSKEYDDLAKFRKRVGDKLNAIEKTLSDLLSSNNVKVPMKHHNSV